MNRVKIDVAQTGIIYHSENEFFQGPCKLRD
jgi:hypothetical protein